MISNKNVGCDGLIIFWKKPRYATRVSQHLYKQLSRGFWDFAGQNFCFKVEQKVISKWGSFGNLLFQSGTRVISRWGRDSYFKVCQCFSMWVKVGQKLFQSGTVTSKWGKILFQSGAVISKWGITLVTWITSSKVKNILLGRLYTFLKSRFSFFWAYFLGAHSGLTLLKHYPGCGNDILVEFFT